MRMLSIRPLRCVNVLLLLVAVLNFPQSSGQRLLPRTGSSSFSSMVEKEIYSIARELFVSRFSAFEREMINRLQRVEQDILQVKIDNEAAHWKQRYLDLSNSVQDLKLSVSQLVTERNLNNAHIQSSLNQHNMTDAISVTTRNEVSILRTEVRAMTNQMADRMAGMQIQVDEISDNIAINSNKTDQISVENKKILIKLDETGSKLWNIENKTEHYLQHFWLDASQQLKAIQSEISVLRNSKNSNETAMLGNLITFAVSLNKLNKNMTINMKKLELVLEEQTRQNRTINSIIKQQDFLGTTLQRLINDTSSFSDYQTTERTSSLTYESSTMHGLNEALCTFEPQEDCFLENSKSDDFDWTTKSGSTPSSDTGPSSASSGSYYSYIEVSDPRKSGDTASLVSKELIKGGEKCIRFDYHMRGDHIGTLKVFRFKKGNGGGFNHEIFSVSGEQGNDWISAAIPVTSVESYKLRIDGIKGSDFKGDIAIDNVRVVPGKCDDYQTTERTTSLTQESNTTIRLNESLCSFEPQEDCFLENSTRDDFNWTTYSGSTSSSGTGPTGASSGLYYSYIEVSDPRKSGDTASLVSKELITGGEKCMRFDYHMRGKHIGTLKVFRFKEGNVGGFNHEIFSLSGEQGGDWISTAIPLTSVESYKLKIVGIKGSDFKGDIAIDNVRIVPGKCDNCSSGWISYKSSCYKFITTPLKTWSNAKAYCSSMKSNLVEIENSTENNFLRRYLSRLSNTGNINDLVNQFWIGNSDTDNEGVWTWATTGSVCGYTDWTKRTNEPNGGRSENCGTMAAKLDYHWNDSKCSLKLKFICEAHV